MTNKAEYMAKYYRANPDKWKYRPEYYQANRDRILKRQLEYQKANPEKVRDTKARYYKAHPPEISSDQRLERAMYMNFLRLAFPDKMRAANRKTYFANHASRRERAKQQYERTKELIRERNRANRKALCEYQKRKHATDINWRLRNILRARIRHCLKFHWKSGRSVELLGCSVESFKIYLESRFEPEMSWANYGKGKDKWNIDHVIPCSLFDLSKPDHQRRCFHFSNLQPMWETENIKKGNKLIQEQEQEYART